MVPVYRYAVSYAHGRDEAWVARFLDELRRRLEIADGPRFHRLVPPPGPPDGQAGSYGVGTADVVLALCSPAYFNEGPAQHDWAILALRRRLGQARTGVTPQTALPLVWEPVDRRLPGPVATADVFSADRLPEYRSLGLALMTMQAPRYRAALDRVLDAIVARMTAMTEAAAPAPELDDRFAGEAPDALSAEDAAFTEQFRKEVAPALPATTVPRTLTRRDPAAARNAAPDGSASDGRAPDERAPDERASNGRASSGRAPDERASNERASDGRASPPAEDVLSADALPELGRRILLVGPPGTGHSTELARLAARALGDMVPGRAGAGRPPWGCRIPFVLSARSGALPRLDGLVPTLAPLAAPQEPAGWAARQLRSGQAFLAVDDLDAVPVGNRAAVWEWLLHLLRTHPQAPCVIATNGTGVPWARLGDAFRVTGLGPLPPDGVRALLGSLAATSSGASGDRRAVTALLRRFDTDPLLLGVAGRPAAAAALLRAAGDPGRPEPVPRHRLLRAGVSAVWRRVREEPAGPSSPSVPVPGLAADQVPDSVLRTASGLLAVAALGLDSSRIPLRTALGALRDPGASDAASPERLLVALADRAGVVFRPGPDTVAFPGPEIRTFLAAQHLARSPGADTDELLVRHPSAELRELLGQLRTAEAGTGTPRSVLATTGGRPRRLSAGSPPPRPAVRRADARSAAELRALLRADTAVTELRCTGPVDELAALLPRLPGLRSLVLADDPSLTALPELGGCRSLRSLRVLRCPNLRDLTVLESSAVMFLDIDPWPDLPVPAGLRRAPWLSRVNLVTGGPGVRPTGAAGAARTADAAGQPGSGVPEAAALPEVRIRRRLRT
ncbi:large ATP-binding protein [Streptomyces sp. NPDC090493]|uniref:large ATP-binding protein n=1 Tax=Streptomyces sp. NPDC090493 TaxID=3365964 RepID=UPI0037FCADEC